MAKTRLLNRPPGGGFSSNYERHSKTLPGRLFVRGEKRVFVAEVASILAKHFNEESILYDKFHEAEFARRDLGIYLPELYHQHSELVVVVICPNYDHKQWTGLEWTAVLDLLSRRNDKEVMLCRFERAGVQGLYSTAGFVELDGRTPAETASLILQRLALNEGKPKDHYLHAPGTDGSTELAPSARKVASNITRNLVYISYRQRDKVWHQALRAILDSDPELRDLIWDDTKIPSGAEFTPEIESHVPRARVMIMLTSADYFGPESGAVECEVNPALEAYRKGVLKILWIPVRAHDYRTTPVSRITAATGVGAIALEKLSAVETEAALKRVHEEVRRCLGLAAPPLPVSVAPASAVAGSPDHTTKRRLIILVHGIRTRAEWQGRIRHLLEGDGGSTVINLGYGYFDVFQFLCPVFTRGAPVEEVAYKIRDALKLHRHDCDEVIFVGHSFATYILGTILRKYPDIGIDRVLLCGSVLRRNYRWDMLPNRPRDVLNEAGSRDIWPILAHSITWGFGSTGTFGFQTTGVRDRYHNLAHSDYFESGFAEKYWLPWIQDGTYVPSDYETGKRPATPLFKNLLEIFHLKWLALILACWLIWLAIGRPLPVRLNWSRIDPVSPPTSLANVRGIIASNPWPLEGTPILNQQLQGLRGSYQPQQQYMSFLSSEFEGKDLGKIVLELRPENQGDIAIGCVVLKATGGLLNPVAVIQFGSHFPTSTMAPINGRVRLLVLLFPLSARGDALLLQTNPTDRVLKQTKPQT